MQVQHKIKNIHESSNNYRYTLTVRITEIVKDYWFLNTGLNMGCGDPSKIFMEFIQVLANIFHHKP